MIWCSDEGVEAGMKTLQEWKDQFQAWVHHNPLLLCYKHLLNFISVANFQTDAFGCAKLVITILECFLLVLFVCDIYMN